MTTAPIKSHANCCSSQDPYGAGYTDCRNACYISTGIALGLLVFGVMYVILLSDGKNGHCHN